MLKYGTNRLWAVEFSGFDGVAYACDEAAFCLAYFVDWAMGPDNDEIGKVCATTQVEQNRLWAGIIAWNSWGTSRLSLWSLGHSSA
jgi:hypothetical protein